MSRALAAIVVLFVGVSLAGATDIDIRVTDMDGNAEVKVEPGEKVEYKVTAVLTDMENEGLALIGFNLSFSGGDLEAADMPTEDPMLNFTRNAGIDNPDGYGGTIIDGVLHQIGGGQNTIKNFVDPENPEFPVGTVITGVAQSDQVIVTGSLTAPQEAGEYTLEIEDLFGTVIRKGETGDPFWHVDLTKPGNIENLTIIVQGGGCNAPKNAKIKGKFKGNDVKGRMKKYDGNTEYTVELFADENPDPVASQQVKTNNRGKAKPKFIDVECGPVYKIATQGCGKINVKRTCKP